MALTEKDDDFIQATLARMGPSSAEQVAVALKERRPDGEPDVAATRDALDAMVEKGMIRRTEARVRWLNSEDLETHLTHYIAPT